MKKIWASKTIIANVVMAVLAIVQLALDQAWIPPEYQVLVVLVINTLLRFLTDKGIEVPAWVPVIGKKAG
jgi:hypothetical protein